MGRARKTAYLKYAVEGDPKDVMQWLQPPALKPMGDTAMCINPNDPKNLVEGKEVIVPLVNALSRSSRTIM